VEEHWATLDGHRMRYLRCGAGPRLLLLHGLLGYSFSWRFNLAALGRVATVYAPDLLGVGFSERSPALDCSLPASAQRMLSFGKTLGCETFDLLGTSHGGALAMMMAAIAEQEQSIRVRRLILCAPVNPWSAWERGVSRIVSSALGSFAVRRFGPHLSVTHNLFLRRMYGDAGRIPPGTLAGYSAPLTIAGTLEHLVAIMRCWNADLRELERVLPRIANIPTLLIWGSRDSAVALASAGELRQRFREARLVVLEGAGHLPYEEVPEEFNSAVVQFLAGA
jgi:pimeloyl-ACP methyl ester carboxylesterase